MECVMETGPTGRVLSLSPEEADATIALFDGIERYEVRRSWEPVCYSVSIRLRGEFFPLLSYVIPFED